MNELRSLWQDYQFLLVPGILVAATCLAFSPVVFNEFAYDDFFTIVYNKHIQTTLSPIYYLTNPGVFWNDNNSHGVYRPVWAWIMALEVRFSELSPLYFHFFSLLLHAFNTVLTYYFIKKLTGRPLPSFIAALLFGLHAVQTETVAWAWQQSILWAHLLLMASCLLILHYTATRQKISYWCAVVLGLLSVLVKDQMLILPFLIGILFYMRLRSFRRSALLTLPFLLIPLIYVGVRFMLHIELAPEPLWASRIEVAKTMINGLAYYFLLLFYPYPLTVDYDVFFKDPPPGLLLALGLVGTIIFTAIALRKKEPLVLFGIAWLLITLIPVSNIIFPMPQVINERFLYTGSLGFAVALTFGLLAIFALFSPSEKKKLALLLLASLPYAVLLGTLAFTRLPTWKSERILWETTLKTVPLSSRANSNYASILHAEGHNSQAFFYYLFSTQLSLGKSNLPPVFAGILETYPSVAGIEAANRLGTRFLKQYPDFQPLHYIYGEYLLRTGQYEAALSFWRSTISKFTLDDKSAFFYAYAHSMNANKVTKESFLYTAPEKTSFNEVNRRILEAHLEIRTGNNHKAIALLEQTLQNNDTDTPTNIPFEWLAQAYSNIGDTDKAAATYTYLLQRYPGSALYRSALRQVLNEPPKSPTVFYH